MAVDRGVRVRMIGPHRPFPPGVDGDMKGAFYERSVRDGSASLYVVIRPRRYMTARDAELIASGRFSVEELHPEVEQLGRRPRPGASWLYKLESFVVDRDHHRDQEAFADHSEDYTCVVFDDFDALMDHCGRTFQISESDFTRDWATNYPQT